MSAFGETASDNPRSPETVIYPKDAADRSADSTPLRPGSGYSNSTYVVVALLLAAGGGWLLWKQRLSGGSLRGGRERKLKIEETRPLGNRQHLVVASYEGRKFLLGITPGRIELLTHLGDEDLDQGPQP